MSVYCLNALNNHTDTLSAQLSRLTGDSFSSINFHSLHDPSSATSAGVLVHKKTGKQFFVPFKAHPAEDGDDRCLEELKRIALFEEGCGGYQWGDYRNADGNFGGTRLDMLEEFGLAERTGKSSPSGMGGSWPEVKVTELGRQVLEGERQRIGRGLSTRKLLDEGKIPKSILAAAEYASESLGAKYDSCITIFDIEREVETAWEHIQKHSPGLKEVDFYQGVAWLKENLERFVLEHPEFADGEKSPKNPYNIPISPAWNQEVGTQVHATFYKNSGKYYAEGIVNLPGAASHDRESVLKAFRDNQQVLRADFYKSPFTVVLRDTPVNDKDPLYREFYNRMTPAADFDPEAKPTKRQNLDISSGI